MRTYAIWGTSTSPEHEAWVRSVGSAFESDGFTLVEDIADADFVLNMFDAQDPKAFRRPWVQRAVLTLVPDTELLQGFCEHHEKTMEHRRIDVAPPEPASPPPERR